MREDLRSIFVGTAGLSTAAVVALLLTILRGPLAPDPVNRDQAVQLFLIGLAVQCLHFAEEFISRFQSRFPLLLGLQGWSDNFFVIFNLIWLSIWIPSVIGLRRGYRFSLFPVWFFGITSIANGVAHPMLALIAHGYFPGLISSPAVGVLGVLLCIKLTALTKSSPRVKDPG